MARRCPVCSSKVPVEPSHAFGPFCSKRCKTIDLGQWLGEGYRIPDERADPAVDDSDVPS